LPELDLGCLTRRIFREHFTSSSGAVQPFKHYILKLF